MFVFLKVFLSVYENTYSMQNINAIKSEMRATLASRWSSCHLFYLMRVH